MLPSPTVRTSLHVPLVHTFRMIRYLLEYTMAPMPDELANP